MIDEKKLAELREATIELQRNGFTQKEFPRWSDVADTIEALWKENAELKASILRHEEAGVRQNKEIEKLKAIVRKQK